MAPSTPEKPIESFLESSPDAFIGFDLSGRIVVVNRAADGLLGYDRTELIGQPIQRVLPALGPKDRAAVGEPSPFLPPLSGLRLDLDATRRDGTAFRVELSLTLIEVRAALMIIARLSPLTAAPDKGAGSLFSEESVQRERRQAARMGGQFPALLGHKLRTPLQSMLTWTQLLRSGSLDQAMQSRALETIELNILRQARVIDDLIVLSEILNEQLYPSVRPVRVVPIIAAAFERALVAAQSKGVELTHNPDAEEAEVLADPDLLVRVLGKLLSNAIRFTSRGGVVRVRAFEVGAVMRITVSDTGQGIDPEVLSRLLDRVRQATSFTRYQEGPGLGLSVVRSLVEMQGGSFDAESEGVGKGVRFTISLQLPRQS